MSTTHLNTSAKGNRLELVCEPGRSAKFVITSATGATQEITGNATISDVTGNAAKAAQNAGLYAGECFLLGTTILPRSILFLIQGALETAAAHNAGIARAHEDAMETILPGLRAMEAAREEHALYSRKFTRMMSDEQNDGVNPPARPKTDLAALATQYPRAALYLRADSQISGTSWSDPSGKASAGEKCKSILLAGGSLEDAKAALAARSTCDVD